MSPSLPKSAHVRLPLIDLARGVAIIGVVIYHLIWDLRLFRFVVTDPAYDIVWMISQKILFSSFLMLAGVSLVLAHGENIRWHGFWKRFGILTAMAIFVSIGTFLAFPDGFVYFGILHALALFSLIGLMFVRAPLWLVAVLAILIFIAPNFIQSDFFNAKYLSWIGFWTIEPYTQDLVPLFPGLGISLAGIVLIRLIFAWPAGKKALGFTSDSWLFRGLVKAGRWSLIIYMVHQPILFGVMTPLANWLQPGAQAISQTDVTLLPPEEQVVLFHQNCVAFCVSPLAADNGSATEIEAANEMNKAQCESYCSCAGEMMTENDMFSVTNIADLTPQQSTIFNAIPTMCRAMVE